MDETTAIRSLTALAQQHRLAVFRLLVRAGPSGLTAGRIATSVGISPASLSFHLKELVYSGLVRTWRQGRNVRATIEVDRVRAFLSFLTEDCCAGRPELCGEAFAATEVLCNPVKRARR